MIDIRHIDADFATLLANPASTAQDLALCIAARYRPVLVQFSRALLSGQNLPGSVRYDRTEEAVQQILADQTARVLAGCFAFKGNSRYSTYLHTILARTLEKLAAVSRKTVYYDDMRTTGRTDDPRLAAMRALVIDRFAECSARLSPVQRQFLSRVLVGEQSIKDAGAGLGFKNPGYQWKLLLGQLKTDAGSCGLEDLYRAYVGERDRAME